MTEQTSEHSMVKLIMWAAALIVVLALIGVFAGPQLVSRMQPAPDTAEDASQNDAIRMGEAPTPAFTAEVQEKLNKSDGFQALVSYTDTGFEPSVATIYRGDTVRFTNNSTHNLMIIQEEDAAVYASGECEIAFESCATIAPRDFWEFTFDTAGEWSYKNDFTSDEGMIEVQ